MVKSLNNNNMPQRPSTFESPTTKVDKNLRKATDMYESLYYKKMLEIAYKDMNVMGNNTGSGVYKDMYLDELSKSAEGKMGLSKMLFEFVKEKQTGGRVWK